MIITHFTTKLTLYSLFQAFNKHRSDYLNVLHTETGDGLVFSRRDADTQNIFDRVYNAARVNFINRGIVDKKTSELLKLDSGKTVLEDSINKFNASFNSLKEGSYDNLNDEIKIIKEQLYTIGLDLDSEFFEYGISKYAASLDDL